MSAQQLLVLDTDPGRCCRLVELLSSGADKAQQNAAKALAFAMEDAQAREQVLQTVRKSADAKNLLAVLAYSIKAAARRSVRNIDAVVLG